MAREGADWRYEQRQAGAIEIIRNYFPGEGATGDSSYLEAPTSLLKP